MLYIDYKNKNLHSRLAKLALSLYITLALSAQLTSADENTESLVYEAGHASLQRFLLSSVPIPENNPQTQKKVSLGQSLFFDPVLSRDGTIACSTCHSPGLGWGDGKKVGVGIHGQVLSRATPAIINTGFNSIQMWDGRFLTLEEQALGPMNSKEEMFTDFQKLIATLKEDKEYRIMFQQAFGEEEISKQTIAKALAAFQRTIVSNDSNFDRWVKGNAKAMTKKQIAGFKLFMDEENVGCSICHSGANFTDNGFHNIGLLSFRNSDPDLGRYNEKPLGILKGAFKTPTLRGIKESSPYFHDGSSNTLEKAVRHYIEGNHIKDNLSPNFKSAQLTDKEVDLIVSFLEALSPSASKQQAWSLMETGNRIGNK